MVIKAVQQPAINAPGLKRREGVDSLVDGHCTDGWSFQKIVVHYVPRSCYARRCIDTTGPVSAQKVLVLANSRVSVHDDGRTLRSKSILSSKKRYVRVK